MSNKKHSFVLKTKKFSLNEDYNEKVFGLREDENESNLLGVSTSFHQEPNIYVERLFGLISETYQINT